MPNFMPDDDPNAETKSRIAMESDQDVSAQTGLLGLDEKMPRPLPSIPGFRVIRELGRGGMGEVYEVVDETLEITYALKMIRPDRVGTRFLDRFRREARTMLLLDHPNIARIFAYGEFDGCPYFTMKFFPDGTLAERLGDFRDDVRKSVQMMSKIAKAVDYLHGKGYVHRDLKPQNILFLDDEPFVSDFGLAKEQGDLEEPGYYPIIPAAETTNSLSQVETRLLDQRQTSANSLNVTLTGGVVGTLPYMSPEQVLGLTEKITAKTDLWSLGVLFHELLHGSRPFDAADKKVLSDLIVNSDPPALPQQIKQIDSALDRIIKKCLSKEPLDRPASAASLAGELDAWLHPPLRTSPEHPFIACRRWCKAHPRRAITVCAAVIALILFAIVVRQPKAKTPTKEEAEASQRQSLRDALSAGKPFTLIADKGWPATGAKVSIIGRDGDLDVAPDGFFAINSVRHTTAELIDDPGVDEYIFRVEARQALTANPEESRIGIYVGHQAVESPAGVLHHFAEFCFTEHNRSTVPKLPRMGLNEFSFRNIWQATGNDAVSENSHNSMKWRETFPSSSHDGRYDWREMAVEVRNNDVRVWWEGQPVRSIPRTFPRGWSQKMQLLVGGESIIPGILSSRCGLGLTVARGSAMFRNARIEPIIAE